MSIHIIFYIFFDYLFILYYTHIFCCRENIQCNIIIFIILTFKVQIYGRFRPCFCTFSIFFSDQKNRKMHLYLVTNSFVSLGSLRALCEDYVQANTSSRRGPQTCLLCFKTFTSRYIIENHIESIHFPATFTYTCQLCAAIFKSRKSYSNHLTRNHSSKQ